jgi:DNA repair protein RadC
MSYKDTKAVTLAAEDRPNNKLESKGIASLTNAELIALIIGGGTSQEEAITAAKELLQMVGHDLNNLARLSTADMMKVQGIGKAKANAIVCANELARRKASSVTRREKITSSADAYAMMRPYLQDLPHEEFWVILLNRANQVLKIERISQGGIAGTVADPKLIFKKALDNLASAIILAHNHPSGNSKPSQADIQLTKKIKQGGEMMEISVLDHIIFTDECCFSFNDEGLM